MFKWQAIGVVLGSMIALTGITGMAVRDTTTPLVQQIDDLKTRVALLEEFKAQQRDYNGERDSHLTNHMDDIIRGQGQQDQRIAVVEGRVSVIYGIGDVSVWALGILVSVFFYYSSRRYRESTQRHDALSEAVAEHGNRIESIEAICSIRHEGHPKHRESED